MRLASFAIVALLTVSALAQAPEADDSQWTMPAKDYASTRYSPLAQISIDNVSQLKPVFSLATGLVRGHEAATVVADNTMYIVTPYPNTVIALDLTQPEIQVKWKFDANPEPSSQGVACCDVVN